MASSADTWDARHAPGVASDRATLRLIGAARELELGTVRTKGFRGVGLVTRPGLDALSNDNTNKS